MGAGMAALFWGLALLQMWGGGAFTVDVEPGTSECFAANAGEGDEVYGNFEVLTEGDMKPLSVKVSPLPWYVVRSGLEAEGGAWVGQVRDPAKKVVFESEGQPEATFSVEAEKVSERMLALSWAALELSLTRAELLLSLQGGNFELCISNGRDSDLGDGEVRTVGFSFRTDILVDEDIASEGEPAPSGLASMRLWGLTDARWGWRPAESIRRLIELGNQLTKGLANIQDHQSYMRQREDLHSSSGSSTATRPLGAGVATLTCCAVLSCSDGEYQLSCADLDRGGGVCFGRSRRLAGYVYQQVLRD
jgi:hypothetical protein